MEGTITAPRPFSVGTEAVWADVQGNREIVQSQNACDGYDYLAAVTCGAVGGLVDIFPWADGAMHKLIKLLWRLPRKPDGNHGLGTNKTLLVQ